MLLLEVAALMEHRGKEELKDGARLRRLILPGRKRDGRRGGMKVARYIEV